MARTPVPGTRERILDVAARLFYEHGVRAVGMNQIIAEAGTGKNVLYTHFPAKADLVAAYLDRTSGRRLASARRARAGADADPRAQLTAVVEEVASFVRRVEFRGCAMRNYLAEFPDDTDRGTADRPAPAGVARAFLASTRREIADLVADLTEDPQAADRLTEQLWLVVDGLYQQAAYRDRTDGGPDRGADAAVALTRHLLATA